MTHTELFAARLADAYRRLDGMIGEYRAGFPNARTDVQAEIAHIRALRRSVGFIK